MSYRKPLLAIALVAVLLVGSVGPVAAHSYQTEIQQGDMELGISSSPEEPIAGLETEFVGSITNTAEDESVTDAEVEVHFNGPNDIHDHVTFHVSEDDPHFDFTYVFPEAGTYTITVHTEIDGEEYAFEFQREAGLIPAEATGEEMEQLSEDVSSLEQSVDELKQSNTSWAGFGITAGVAALVGLGAFLAGRRF